MRSQNFQASSSENAGNSGRGRSCGRSPVRGRENYRAPTPQGRGFVSRCYNCGICGHYSHECYGKRNNLVNTTTKRTIKRLKSENLFYTSLSA